MDRFLFFDIDGTLVGPSNVVPESAWKAIEQCTQNGDHAFLCTGRTLSSAKGFDCPKMEGTIFTTGAGIETERFGTMLFSFPEEDVKHMRDTLLKAGCGIVLFTKDYGYADPDAYERMIGYGRMGGHSAEEVLAIYGIKPLDSYQGEEVLKFDVYFPNQLVMNAFVENDLPASAVWKSMGYAVDASGVIYGEINPKGVSKGSAVTKILELYGGKRENSYGFGDSMNDAEMMLACGHGIAMGASSQQLKELAEFVTLSVDEDGIAYAMKHYGLI